MEELWRSLKWLYDNEWQYDFEVQVSHPGVKSGRHFGCTVEIGSDDCKVGHFGYNLWIRTPMGVKAKRYSSRGHLEAAVKKTMENKGFTVHGWM